MADAGHVVSFPINGAASSAPALATDPGLGELIRLYGRAPERDCGKLLVAFRAAAEVLARQVDMAKPRK